MATEKYTKKKVSLKQIAEAAGVSSALVSMVLNGKAKQYGIGDEAARRVLDIAREMHYQPNLMARSLRSGRSHLIGLVVADIANPFFSDLAREIENTAKSRGYTVVYASTDEQVEMLNRQVGSMYNQGIDGIIVVPCEGSEKVMEGIASREYPMVLLDRDMPGVNAPAIMIDNAAASAAATRLLLEKGSRHISLISYDSGMNHVQERIRGYRETMLSEGLQPDIHLIDYTDVTCQMRRELSALFEKKGTTDALLFCTNALTREGLFLLREFGLKVPDDVAVFGFDGGDVFNMFDPPVSYLVQPIGEMGRLAANRLINIIEGNPVGPVEKFTTHMVITSSVEKRS